MVEKNLYQVLQTSILNHLFLFQISKVKKVVDKNATYEIGERISHTDFGEGIVISIDKSILTVAFPHPIGIKKLMKGHPNITKL